MTMAKKCKCEQSYLVLVTSSVKRKYKKSIFVIHMWKFSSSRVISPRENENITGDTDRNPSLQAPPPHLNSCERRHDSRTAEAVSHQGEVGEVPLNLRVQDDLRPRVAEGRPVLVQQVHQLLRDLPVTRRGGDVTGGVWGIREQFGYLIYH